MIRFPARSPPACTALSFANESAGRFACLLPCERFRRPQDRCFQARRLLPLYRDRVARNGLSLACNGCYLSAASIPGSKLRTCHFAPFQAGFRARSAFRLCYRCRFAPVAAASTLQARCSFRRRLLPPRYLLALPSGTLTSLGIKAWASIAAVRPAFRIRPISSRSPQPFR